MDDVVGSEHGGESCTYTLFQLVNHSSSMTVVECFIGLLVFTIFMELSLEKLEDIVQGTVVQEVLEKLYKELMILGFVSFGIFIVLTSYGDALTIGFISSFEYAHFVLFFVGMGLILHTAWTVYSNKAFQRNIYRACGANTTKLLDTLKEKSISSSSGVLTQMVRRTCRSVELDYLTLQTYRMIFLLAHDLPHNFLFAHYTCTSINAITVGFMNLQPSSFGMLALLIFTSETFIRNHPRYLYGDSVSQEGDSLSFQNSTILFSSFGFMICLCGFLLIRVLKRACFEIVKGFLSVDTMEEAFIILLQFSEHSQNTRKGRSMSKLERDFQLLLDPEGRNTTKITSVTTASTVSVSSASSVTSSLSSTSSLPPPLLQMNQGQAFYKTSSPGIKVGATSRSSLSNLQQEPDMKPLNKKYSLKRSTSIFPLRKSASDKESDRRRRKTTVMMKQHKSVGGKKRHSALEAALMSDRSWTNAEAEVIGESAREKLPFKSITMVLKMVDMLKVFKIFFLSVFITSFVKNSGSLSVEVQLFLWCSFFTVVVSTMFLDPLLTYEYGLLTTIASVNPLLIGETVEHMADVHQAVAHLSRWVVVEHVVFINERMKKQDVVDFNSDELVFQLLKQVFGEWDSTSAGFIARTPFMIGLKTLKISNRQKNALFKILDIDLNGKIIITEFCSRLGPHLKAAINDYLQLLQNQPEDKISEAIPQVTNLGTSFTNGTFVDKDVPLAERGNDANGVNNVGGKNGGSKGKTEEEEEDDNNQPPQKRQEEEGGGGALKARLNKLKGGAAPETPSSKSSSGLPTSPRDLLNSLQDSALSPMSDMMNNSYSFFSTPTQTSTPTPNHHPPSVENQESKDNEKVVKDNHDSNSYGDQFSFFQTSPTAKSPTNMTNSSANTKDQHQHQDQDQDKNQTPLDAYSFFSSNMLSPTQGGHKNSENDGVDQFFGKNFGISI